MSFWVLKKNVNKTGWYTVYTHLFYLNRQHVMWKYIYKISCIITSNPINLNNEWIINIENIERQKKNKIMNKFRFVRLTQKPIFFLISCSAQYFMISNSIVKFIADGCGMNAKFIFLFYTLTFYMFIARETLWNCKIILIFVFNSLGTKRKTPLRFHFNWLLYVAYYDDFSFLFFKRTIILLLVADH